LLIELENIIVIFKAMFNKVTVIGSANRDLMFYTDNMLLLDNKSDLLRQRLIAFEYGAKIYSRQVYFTYGGGGADVAVGLASLGISNQAILSLGDDLLGREMLTYLQSKKVKTSLVQRYRGAITGTSAIINVGHSREHVIFVYRGANDRLELSPVILQKINTPWLYMASLPEHFKNKLDDLFAHCQKRKIKVAWNPGGHQLKLSLKFLSKYLKQTQVFNVNRDEALELLVSLKDKKTKNNIQQIIKTLHSFGQKITVITDGQKGAYVYDGQKIYFRAADKKKVVNTTGAGDAFGSGFVAGLIRYKGDIEKSLKLGILNSGSVVKKIGAQIGLLTVKDLKKYKL
jgi:fructokinase